MSFRVSRAAAADLINILEQGIRQFGPAQATSYIDGIESAFQLLADFPKSSPERGDLYRMQRIYPFGAHLIFYALEPDGSVLITRIRHGREDWNPNS
ncbi:MAG: type II toxin-antitoxin system RelE/ParE family toxin [Hyphomonas sp.]|nr:type II toxin-antitoxin system RelE/ParE family toxin [Hyphomonas sp.]